MDAHLAKDPNVHAPQAAEQVARGGFEPAAHVGLGAQRIHIDGNVVLGARGQVDQRRAVRDPLLETGVAHADGTRQLVHDLQGRLLATVPRLLDGFECGRPEDGARSGQNRSWGVKTRRYVGANITVSIVVIKMFTISTFQYLTF